MVSPLLVGFPTDTPLDYLLKPFTKEQIDFLNKDIYVDSTFHINNWSLLHLLSGLIWGLLYKKHPFFNLLNFVILHSIFEFWEVWAVHLVQECFTFKELVDIIMDTLFGIVGFILAGLF